MKSTELRIGNYVYGYENQMVEGVNAAEIRDFDNGKINFEPIPLTEERLLKFGGVSDEPSTPFFIVSMPRNIGEIRVNPHNNMTWLRHWRQDYGVMNPDSLLYVHQLQNLYFALTGEELEVKS